MLLSILKNLYVALMTMIFSINAFAVMGGVPLQAQDAVSRSVVNIKLKNGMCTGTLIAPTVVLTAAHCADMLGEAELVAHINAEATVPCNVSSVIESAYVPNAVQDLPFNVHSPDILLLRLKAPLCQIKTVSFDRAMEIKVGDILKGAGHGQGNHKFGEAEFFELQITETKNIEDLVSPIDHIISDLLTIGIKTYKFALPLKQGSSFCAGDSGGPVYVEKNGIAYQLGVNGAVLPNEKLGVTACNLAYVQMITPLAPYMDWIEKKLSDWK